jgi:hypothetical protein
MNILRAGGWFSLSAGLVLGASSCEGKNDISEITGLERPDPSAGVAEAGGCVPGQTLPCAWACGAFGSGYQVCAADGRSYGECLCSPAPDIGSMSLSPEGSVTVIPPRVRPDGAGSLGASGGPVLTAARIGTRCEVSDDCGGGLDCLSEASNAFGSGGPAGGYCTMGCADSADCSAVDRTSTCAVIAGRSICLRSCQSQDPAEGEAKCLDRPELTCLSSAASGDEEPSGEPQFGICAPRCQSDAACGGRLCDLASGLCTDTRRPGAAPGAACAEPAVCASGLCLGATAESPGLCSSFCTLGVPGCGYDGSEAVIGAACLLAQVPGEGEGDSGLCFALCDLDSECSGEGFLCVPEPAAAESGRSGVCLPASFVAPEEPPVEPENPGQPATGLGGPCEQDGDCTGGFTCLAASSDPFGDPGGPAGGYCSQTCEGNEDCPASGVCLVTPGGGYCFAACTPEASGACGGRADVQCLLVDTQAACLPVCDTGASCGERSCDIGRGLCVDAPEPSCTSDADCVEGSCDLATGECVAAPLPCTSDADCAEGSCDLATSLCVSVACSLDDECGAQVCDAIAGSCIAAPPTPIGAACTDDIQCTGEAASADDPRLCLPLVDSAFCSAVCLVGTPFGCEAYGTDAFCVLPVEEDVGLCLELCNTPDECEQAGYECADVGTEINGRSGVCFPPPAPEATPAP